MANNSEGIDLTGINELLSRGGYDKPLDPKITNFTYYNRPENAGSGKLNQQIQEEYNRLIPSNPIKVDGVWGEQTNSAIMGLKNLERLKVDGEPVVSQPIVKPTYIAAEEEKALSKPQHADKYQLNPLLAEFEKLRPQKGQDTERMRKIAMIQALGSGLRNIVDLSFAGSGGDAKRHNDHQYTLKMADRANELDDRYEQEDKAHNLRMLQEKLRQSDLYSRYLQDVDSRNAAEKKAARAFDNQISVTDWQNQVNRAAVLDDRAFQGEQYNKRLKDSIAAEERGFNQKKELMSIGHKNDLEKIALQNEWRSEAMSAKLEAERQKKLAQQLSKGFKTVPYVATMNGRMVDLNLTTADRDKIYNWAAAKYQDVDMKALDGFLSGEAANAKIAMMAQQYIQDYISSKENEAHVKHIVERGAIDADGNPVAETMRSYSAMAHQPTAAERGVLPSESAVNAEGGISRAVQLSPEFQRMMDMAKKSGMSDAQAFRLVSSQLQQ